MVSNINTEINIIIEPLSVDYFNHKADNKSALSLD